MSENKILSWTSEKISEGLQLRNLFWDARRTINSNAEKFSEHDLKQLRDLSLVIWRCPSVKIAQHVSKSIIDYVNKSSN